MLVRYRRPLYFQSECHAVTARNSLVSRHGTPRCWTYIAMGIHSCQVFLGLKGARQSRFAIILAARRAGIRFSHAPSSSPRELRAGALLLVSEPRRQQHWARATRGQASVLPAEEANTSTGSIARPVSGRCSRYLLLVFLAFLKDSPSTVRLAARAKGRVKESSPPVKF